MVVRGKAEKEEAEMGCGRRARRGWEKVKVEVEREGQKETQEER